MAGLRTTCPRSSSAGRRPGSTPSDALLAALAAIFLAGGLLAGPIDSSPRALQLQRWPGTQFSFATKAASKIADLETRRGEPRTAGFSLRLFEEAPRECAGIGRAASELRSAAESWDPSDGFAFPGGGSHCRLSRAAKRKRGAEAPRFDCPEPDFRARLARRRSSRCGCCRTGRLRRSARKSPSATIRCWRS